MFGQNKIIVPNYSKGGEYLNVHSTFDTIQGEGPFAGHRAFFIRLAGCNLKCYFCDTDFEEGERVLIKEIVKEAHASLSQLVVITGGEPMAQDIKELVRLLLEYEWSMTVQIETSGTCFPSRLCSWRYSSRLHIVISPKTSHVRKELLSFANVYFKYVINARDGVDPDDGLPIHSTQKEGKPKRLYRPPATDVGEEINQWPIYVAPCFEYCDEEEANKRNTDLCINIVKKHGYILSLQQHKIIGVE